MDKLNITSGVLDALGFSPYWDEHGDWGGRALTFSDGTRFRIMEHEETDDESQGYGERRYRAHRFVFAGWFATPKLLATTHYDLHFITDMYRCIAAVYPDCLEEFHAIAERVGMGSYLPEPSVTTAWSLELCFERLRKGDDGASVLLSREQQDEIISLAKLFP